MVNNFTKKIDDKPLRVAIIAPPWLAMPIKGYGGVELVLQALIKELQAMNVDVTLFANGARTMDGVKTLSLYKEEVYPHIFLPMNESICIVNAHLQFALNHIMKDGKFDVVHNNIEFVGTQVMNVASMLERFPPVVHTHHGPPFSPINEKKINPLDASNFFNQLGQGIGKYYIVGISDALMAPAPSVLKPHILQTVHNAIDIDKFPFVAEKKNYFYTMARFNTEKAQHIAARICAKNGYRLRMAGTVAGIESNRKLLFELANPMSDYRSRDDFKYFSNQVLPFILKNQKITYSGNLSGRKKMKFMSEARALLFPIQWDEPFGMAVIEALACGTPVIAMRRGAMPEIIEHGVNGFLCDNEGEFEVYMKRIDEISPAACRKSVEDKFTAKTMAEKYLERYNEAIRRAKKAKA